jgi:hypothetical protein
MRHARLGAVLTAVLLLLTSLAAPMAVAAPTDAYDDRLSASAEQATDSFTAPWEETATDIVRADSAGTDNAPTWLVRVEAGRLSTLESWTNSSAARRTIDTFNDSRWAVIVAPSGHIDGGVWFWGDTLLSKSYVEAVDLNRRHSLADPITDLQVREAASPPTDSALLRDADYNDTGVAYDDDAEQTTLADARSAMNVDSVSETGTNVTVGVLDTGCNWAEGRAFGNGTRGSSSRIVGAKNLITNESTNASADYAAVEDGNGHGSWVATAAVGNLTGTSNDGVAPDADLLCGKTLADDGSGSTADIVEGIYWAERQNATILSLSLGSPTYSGAIATAVQDAKAGNMTAVYVAAGNSRQSPVHAQRYISSPADVDGTIAVAATTSDPAADAAVAYFSEVGPDSGATDLSRGVTNGEGPDVAAPGMKIQAEVPTTGGTLDNRTLSGTSMATPLAAGAGALAIENDTDDLYNETGTFRTRILDTARPMPHAGTTEVGHGMTDAAYAANGTTPDGEQLDERSDAALARDLLNEQYSQSGTVRVLINGGSDLSGLVGG